MVENLVESINRIAALPTVSSEELFAKPFVVSGHMRQYRAFEKWTPEFFADHCGDFNHPVISRKREKKEQSVRDYMAYLAQEPDDGEFYYLKDWHFERNFPEFLDDYSTPDVFRSWISHVPAEVRPVLRWLYIGVKNSGSYLHVDVMHTGAWNGVISGRKLWLFYPPEQKEYLYDLKLDAFRPDFEQFPLFRNAQAICCIQEPGDLVYTPSGWPHQVINLESGVSVTENFVNSTNCEEVAEFLKAGGQQQFLAVLQQLGGLKLPY